MANREIFAAGLGVGFAGTTYNTASAANGSLTWLPAFVTTQSAWSSGTAYAAATDLACGAQVSSGSSTYVCLVKGSGNSTTNPTSGTTTQGATTGVLADGYNWLCIGNATADFTTLASGSQAVSQIFLDSRPSQTEGDTMMEISVSLATAVTSAVGLYVTLMLQWLNQDGSTYADGLGSGSNPSSPQVSQGNIWFSPGKSSPVVGSIIVPMRAGRCRLGLVNSLGGALSSSGHVVAFRTIVFGLNG
jgi:hypothetical protein